VDIVLDVLDQAAEWVKARGAEGWTPGQWRRERLLEAIVAGETNLARNAEAVVGTVTLQWTDETFWPGAPPDAGYVHRLAVTKSAHGQGVGRAMLDWAEQATRDQGRSLLRLDCAAGNPALRAYYESQGFELRGEVTHVGKWGTYRAARYEKPLDKTTKT
jgi:GNAT superfamily N-acetyltransferase